MFCQVMAQKLQVTDPLPACECLAGALCVNIISSSQLFLGSTLRLGHCRAAVKVSVGSGCSGATGMCLQYKVAQHQYFKVICFALPGNPNYSWALNPGQVITIVCG